MYFAGERAALMPVNARPRFANSKRARRKTLQGYPLPTIKKNGACVVTYRHSGDRLLENGFPPRPFVNKL